MVDRNGKAEKETIIAAGLNADKGYGEWDTVALY